MSAERDFVSHFIRPDRQQPYLELLASPGRRRKFFGSLAKSCDLQPSVVEEISEECQSAESIADILRRKGAGDICYAISEDAEIDGREVRLSEALQRVVAHGRATFLSCVPGVLGYQEKLTEYKSVANYFDNFFNDADICILSSHTHGDSATHIEEMIQQLKRRCYNIAGVFFSNNYDSEARDIALLPWDEVLWIENPPLTNAEAIDGQLDQIARHFSELLIARAYVQ